MRALVLCALILALPCTAHAATLADDRPPAIAWTAPEADATLEAGLVNPLTVTATDDHGIVRVRFLDDDEEVCEITAPPFTCRYTATTGDVGHNTFSAVAVDTSGQTTTIERAVTIDRFRAPFKLKIKRGYRLTGQLESVGAACRGTVTVRAVVGRRTLATRRVKLTSRCAYATTIPVARQPRLRFTARFGGNALIMPRSVSKAVLR